MLPRSVLLITLALAVPLLARVALADIYKCTTLQGKVAYQDHPCVDSEVPMVESSGSMPTPEAQRQQSPSQSSPRTPTGGAAPPIALRLFGAIRPGMTETEVTQRLGPPLRVIDGGTVQTTARSYGFSTSSERHRHVWIYPGPAQIPELHITFASGLVEKTNAP